MFIIEWRYIRYIIFQFILFYKMIQSILSRWPNIETGDPTRSGLIEGLCSGPNTADFGFSKSSGGRTSPKNFWPPLWSASTRGRGQKSKPRPPALLANVPWSRRFIYSPVSYLIPVFNCLSWSCIHSDQLPSSGMRAGWWRAVNH